MEMLAFGGLVGAHVGVAGRQAEIGDVAEQMPHRVLRARIAEMHADAPIGRSAVGDRLPLDRQPAQQHKAAPVEHFVAQAVEHRAEDREGEIGAGQRGEVAPADLGDGRLDLADLGGRQGVDPGFGLAGQLGADPGGGAFDQRAGQCRHL